MKIGLEEEEIVFTQVIARGFGRDHCAFAYSTFAHRASALCMRRKLSLLVGRDQDT